MTRQNAQSGPELPAQLASEIRALMARLRRRLREQASPGEFTPSQVAVIVRLEREGAGTVSSLARAEGMRPQSMGAVIAQLEATGLLNALPDPDDGRQTLWSLTDACATWLRESRAARQDWLTRTIEARLSADEQQELAAALDLLQRLAEA
ncbi:MarR family winged helix-turn-helix transcriptional regulator [Paraburkholderia sp. B3]|uniref:MarR family winged helix-turn-helix transcriptional regulator n=1 Tax=Paraburkholderia sp. B3 TaxID=3134791 RepID=UPI003982794E